MELKKVQFNFDKLLKPYEDGGTEENPIKRTIGTIASKLMVSYRIPPDIVGAAIYKVFYKMAHEGLEFEGNGKYGSKGAELFSCIKSQCIEMTQKESIEKVRKEILNLAACTDRDCRFRSQVLEKQDWKFKVKRYFGLRSGWFSAFVTILPILVLLIWLCTQA